MLSIKLPTSSRNIFVTKMKLKNILFAVCQPTNEKIPDSIFFFIKNFDFSYIINLVLNYFFRAIKKPIPFPNLPKINTKKTPKQYFEDGIIMLRQIFFFIFRVSAVPLRFQPIKKIFWR